MTAEIELFECTLCTNTSTDAETYFTWEPNEETFNRLWPFYKVLSPELRSKMFPLEGGNPLCPMHGEAYDRWMKLNEFVNDYEERPYETKETK